MTKRENSNDIVDAQLKNWKFITQTIQNSFLPFVSDHLDIVSALLNTYECSSMKKIINGKEIAAHVLEICKKR